MGRRSLWRKRGTAPRLIAGVMILTSLVTVLDVQPHTRGWPRGSVGANTERESCRPPSLDFGRVGFLASLARAIQGRYRRVSKRLGREFWVLSREGKVLDTLFLREAAFTRPRPPRRTACHSRVELHRAIRELATEWQEVSPPIQKNKWAWRHIWSLVCDRTTLVIYRP